MDGGEIGQAARLQRHIADLLGHVERHAQFCLGLSQIAVPKEIEAERKLIRRAQLRDSPAAGALPAPRGHNRVRYPRARSGCSGSVADSSCRTTRHAGPVSRGFQLAGARERCVPPSRPAGATSTAGSDARSGPGTTLPTRRDQLPRSAHPIGSRRSRIVQPLGRSRRARFPTSCRSCGRGALVLSCRPPVAQASAAA